MECRGFVRAGRERNLDIMLAVYSDTISDTPIARRALRGFVGFNRVTLRAWLRGEASKDETVWLLTETLTALLAVVIPSLERTNAER